MARRGVGRSVRRVVGTPALAALVVARGPVDALDETMATVPAVGVCMTRGISSKAQA